MIFRYLEQTLSDGAPPDVTKTEGPMTDKRLTIALLAALAVLALVLCYFIVQPFFGQVMTAIVLAIAFFPLHVRVAKRIRSPLAAALVSVLIIIAAVLLPVTLITLTAVKELGALVDSMRQLSAQSGGLTAYVTGQIDRLAAWVGQYVSISQVDAKAQLVEKLQSTGGLLVKSAGALMGNVLALILNTVLVLFLMVFLFRDGPRLVGRLARVLPLGANQVDRLCRGVSETVQASMFGMMAVALAQAVLQGTGFWFLGVPGPVLWGTVTVFASLLPVIGAASVWIPAAVWLFLAGSWVKGIVLIAWGVGVVGMADNLLRPYVMSGKVAMHPLILFFALMGGVQAFGMIGLFAGPVIVAVTQTLFELLAEELRGRGILAAKEDAPG